jgi:hypothetical protein
MAEDKIVAEVTKVTKQTDLEGSEAARAGLFTVEAKVSAPEYSDKIFVVRIPKSDAPANLQSKQESLMEDGAFQFVTANEMKIGDQLEVSISRPPAEQVERAL